MSDGGVPAGDFETFHRATFSKMLARAMFYVGNIQDAEDALQEAYVTAWKRWDRITTFYEAEGLILLVLRQRAWKGRKDGKVSSIDELDGIVSNQATVEETVWVRHVLDELSLLPHGQRVVMALHCLQGHTQDEVAQKLEGKRNTIAGAVYLARRKLARSLGIAESKPNESLVSVVLSDDDPLLVVLDMAEKWLAEAIEADGRALEHMCERLGAGMSTAEGGRP
ncbi:sigma factor-like helix-turn-helix DNA-binding protein [Streptosporangium sp. NPDC023963]|uniref:RNA polymerase sigma factor n=1 Tax=Streptosporangium sp. NPDC023963 TaxID=3155608 RepID=UPI0034150CD8